MNTLLWRTLGKVLSILFRSLISVGLIQGINSPLYAQTATDAPDSYILTVERCVEYIESVQWVYRDYQWSFSITPTPCARKHHQKGLPSCGTNSPVTIPIAATGKTPMACVIN
ncbi:hypothetical protein ACFQD2_05025 [Pseudomonas lini]